ncbi:MAG: haloacid dehalogenase, partial [Nocardioidaceae bacterium]
CSRLRVDPARAAAFEDSTSGVRAAVSAGISQVFGVLTTSDREALRAAGAHHVIDDLSAIA